MNKFEKNSVKKYDRLAHDYDKTLDGRMTAKFKREILGLLLVADGDSVLDVGCGNGSLLAEISRKANVSAHGIDISPNMIAECRERYPHMEFQVSAAESLPFDDGSFDILVICCVLHHLNNPQRFFAEARRVLKANGVLIVGEPWLPIIAKQLMERIVFPIHNAGDNKFFTHGELQQLFTRNGFSLGEVRKKGFMQIITGERRCQYA